MVRAHIWLRKKDGMSAEEFGRYWIERHAPIARDGYSNLKGYVVTLVSRIPDGQTAAYDGVAELTWDDRDGFKADMASETNAKATADLASFSDAMGFVYVEQTVVK